MKRVDVELAGRGDQPDLRLAGAAALADDEVAQEAAVVVPVPRRGLCPRQNASDLLAQLVDALGDELAVGHRHDVVPAAGRVEAAHQLAVLAGAERELDLVAVAPLLVGGDDRLELEVRRAGRCACSASSTCSALTASWRSYGQHLPRRARMVGDLGDAVRRGLDDLDRARLRVRLLGLADDGAHAVAGHAAGHEHDVALEAGDAVAAVGERIDRELEHVAARRPGESGRGHAICEDDRVSIDDPDELAALRAAGRVVAEAIREMARRVRPGVTTAELDEVAAAVFARHGARSGPQLDYDFPGTVCISVDDECVHGIPGPRRLREGQLVKLDVTAELDGFYADACRTVHGRARARRASSGSPPPRSPRCARGLEAATAGANVGAIGAAVQTEVERRGFSVCAELTGHGIGRRDPRGARRPERRLGRPDADRTGS